MKNSLLSKTFLELDYRQLAEYWMEHLSRNVELSDTPFGVNGGFDALQQYLGTKVSHFMDPAHTLDDSDEELMSVLFKYHTEGVVEEIKVSRSPGVVIHVDNHHVTLPLVLIVLKL